MQACDMKAGDKAHIEGVGTVRIGKRKGCKNRIYFDFPGRTVTLELSGKVDQQAEKTDNSADN